MFDIRGVNSSAFKFVCETVPAKNVQRHAGMLRGRHFRGAAGIQGSQALRVGTLRCLCRVISLLAQTWRRIDFATRAGCVFYSWRPSQNRCRSFSQAYSLENVGPA